MKINFIIWFFILVALTFPGAYQITRSAQASQQPLLEQQVASVEIIQDNPQRALAILADEYHVPIAVEFPSNLPRKGAAPVPCLKLEGVSVKDVLDAIVRCNPDYQWSNNDGIITITSTASTASKEILDTLIERIEIKNQRRAEIRKTIAELPEFRTKFYEAGYEIRYLPRLGAAENNLSPISFSLSKVTLREALNYLIRNTYCKYWSVSVAAMDAKKRLIYLSLW